jgi:DNA-binding MarR family transcriptional regulator
MPADDADRPPADRPRSSADRAAPPGAELEDWPTGRLLSAAARLVEHAWNAHLAGWDLNHAGLAVLHVLLGGPLTQRELAALVQVEDQTLSRTVERLERSGYVERHRDTIDRRRIVVSPTDAGREAFGRAGDLSVAESFFTGLGDDLTPLRRALTTIVRHHAELRWPDGHHDHPGAGSGPGPDRTTAGRVRPGLPKVEP